jgi:Cu(I)/Ag(I) efflux system membrane fusion protein
MTRRRFIGMAAGLILAATVVWLISQPAMLSLAESRQDDMADMPGTITIPSERLQTIGVKYEQVARRPLEKVIRTVGRVAVDERKLAKVTTKFHGWIEQLFVSATGDHVKKGQALFTIYSPDLGGYIEVR